MHKLLVAALIVGGTTAAQQQAQKPLERLEANIDRITGSEALDYYEVAAIFSEVLGRTIVYENPSNEAYGDSLRKEGMREQSIKGL
jgi:uncharacterized protein YbjT (DUF2867 family)